MLEATRNGLNERIEELYQTSGVGLLVETLTDRMADGAALGLQMSLGEFKQLLTDELSVREGGNPEDASVSIAVG